MNDDLTPEELASAYLDGEVSDTERALVESSPELLALVARYRTIAEAVAEPVVVPSAMRRDAAIAAALAVGPRPAVDATVSSLDARRSRRWPAPSTMAGAAAAVVLLVGALGVVAQLGGGSGDDDTATGVAVSSDEDRTEESTEESTEEAADTEGTATDGAEEAPAAEAPAEEATEAPAEEEPEATQAPTEEATEEATEAVEEAADGEATQAPTEEPATEAPGALVTADLGTVETQRALDLAIAGFIDDASTAPTEGEADGGAGSDAEAPECNAEAIALAGEIAITAIGRIGFQGRVLEIYLLDTEASSPEFLTLERPGCAEFTS